MASTQDYIDFVEEQIRYTGNVRYKKMFGEYMVYVDDRPVILVCNNMPHVKKHEIIYHLMEKAEVNTPYNGAKEHYILDIEDEQLTKKVIELLVTVTPVPKPKIKKKS